MPTKKTETIATTRDRTNLYDAIITLLSALYSEIQELSKKKPDVTLNSQKVKMINRLLNDLLIILVEEPTAKYLDLVNDEDLPQYSDVVIILSQYVAAMKAFHSKYHRYIDGTHKWALLD